MISTCENCGKSFFHPYVEWGYYYDGKICCSYKCMREMRAKEFMGDGQMKGRHLTKQDREQMYGLFDGGKTVKEVMQLTGLAHTTVERYRREWKTYVITKGLDLSTKVPETSTEAPEMSTETQEMVTNSCEDAAQKYEKAKAAVENVQKAAEYVAINAGQLINTLCDIVALIKQIYDKSRQ